MSQTGPSYILARQNTLVLLQLELKFSAPVLFKVPSRVGQMTLIFSFHLMHKILAPRLPAQILSDFLWAYKARFSEVEMELHRKLRFVLRTILSFRSSAQWFGFIRQTPLLSVVSSEPQLLDIVHRPFFDYRMPQSHCAARLISHYRYFFSVFQNQSACTATLSSGLLLGWITGRSGCCYNLRLVRLGQFDKEGCLSLQFVDPICTRLTLSFSFLTDVGFVKVCIGGLQSMEDGRDALRAATHDLFGLQPRLLLVWVLRVLVQALGIASIDAIDRAHHVYQSPRYKPKKAIYADYDDFWNVLGGKRQSNGAFCIPATAASVMIEHRPSRKRAMYRRRDQALDCLRHQILSSLNAATQNVPSLFDTEVLL